MSRRKGRQRAGAVMRRAGLRAQLVWLAAMPAVAAPPPVIIPAPPPIKASAHILIDHDSGRVLAEHAADEQLPPASLTKMMTLHVVLGEMARGAFSMEDQVVISEKAWRAGGSKMFIEVGKSVPVSELLRGIIISSGNDASIALAEHVSGSERAFAELMNGYAAALGMNNSRFENSSGLPSPQHYSSARDLALLSSALIRSHPEIYRLHAVKEYTYGGIKQSNRNLLLWQDDSVDGIKTGHTDAAGYCLAASALRDGMRLVSVVMGTPSEESRTSDSLSLLNYGFRFYETGVLQRAGQAVLETRVWKGSEKALRLGLEDDLTVTWPRGAKQALEHVIDLGEDRIVAPVAQGQRLGELRIEHAGKVLARRPLLALHDVAAGGVWRRVGDQVRIWWPGEGE